MKLWLYFYFFVQLIDKANEIDRRDIPYDFVEDVQTLAEIMKYGSDNNLIGHTIL
ncbi:MAG: hypothetical protein K6F55_11110 [Eubacterium sp.]|nr:hypothetical protein [Eubacterium sp.]